MAERSYLRNAHGPRTVDSGSSREKGHTSRRSREGGEKGHHRSKQESSRKTPKETTHQRRHSPVRTEEAPIERAQYELDVIGQPPKGVALGIPVETSVMLSLRLSSPNGAVGTEIDTSRLFAVTSLVADSRSGERLPLESGIMTGQKMFDSVHSIPDECAERLASNEPCRLALGYFSFPGLLIRQSGTYRIRTTLIRMNSSGTAGGSSIVAVDSEPIKVERRSSTSSRRHQRVYSQSQTTVM
jgi:hypothetical protein